MQELKPVRTVEWCEMPPEVDEAWVDQFEIEGHYTYHYYTIGEGDSENETIIDNYLLSIGAVSGETVLVLVDW